MVFEVSYIDLDPVAFPDMIRTYYDPSDLNYYVFSLLCIDREANDDVGNS